MRRLCAHLLAVTAAALAAPEELPTPIRGAFLSWAPTEQAASALRDAGLSHPCYYLNRLYRKVSDDPADLRIQWQAEPLQTIQGWERLAPRFGLELLACVNTWAGDEGAMFAGKDFRHLITADGRDAEVPCPTDLHYWDVLGQETELLAAVGPGVKGVLLDLEAYEAGAVYPGYGARKYNECYCSDCFGRYLKARGLAGALPVPAGRFPLLVTQGRTDDYEASMESRMAAVGQQLGARLQARRPGLRLGVINPFGWHGRGLVKGLAQSGEPVLVWCESTYWRGYSPEWDRTARDYQALGPRVRVAGGLALSGWGPRGLALQAAHLAERSQGYWLFCANSLFATRQQQEQAEGVWRLKVLYADRYLAELAQVSRALPPSAAPVGGEEQWSTDLLAELAEGQLVESDAGYSWPDFAAEELLSNGSFEEDFGNLADPEALRRWRAYYAHPERVPDGPRVGQFCCRIKSRNAEQPCAVYQTFPAQAGQTYRFQGFFRTEYLVAGQGLRPLLGEAAAGCWRGHYPGWTPFNVTATCPADKDRLSVAIEMHYTLGTVWLDGLSVTVSPQRAVLTRPFGRPAGQAWGRLRWEAAVPAGARLDADLLQPAETTEGGRATPAYPLALGVADGQSLALLNRLPGIEALQVRVTAEPAEDGRYPILAHVRLSTLPQ